MEIKEWFEKSGSYAIGISLYRKLPGHNPTLLKSFSKENTANFLKLKYELKKALLAGQSTIIPIIKEIVPEPTKTPQKEPMLELIIKASAAQSFEKETMALYPIPLHPVYRQRINDFYQACELKFQLNALAPKQESEALMLIFQLEDLWTKIDRAWIILDHWKDHNRIMPTEESEDFSKLNGIQLVKLRANLESRISKREKTIGKMQTEVLASPEDRSLTNLLNRKLEQLQQLTIDLQTIRTLLKNE